MDLNINVQRLETLVLCGRLVEAAHDETSILNYHGDDVEVLEVLAKLVGHLHIGLPGPLPLLGRDFEEAARQIKAEVNRPPPF